MDGIGDVSGIIINASQDIETNQTVNEHDF